MADDPVLFEEQTSGSARRWQKVWCNRAVLSVAIVTVLIALFFILLFCTLPSKEEIRSYQPASVGSDQVFNSSQPPAELVRIWKPLRQISPLLQQAVIISEDDTFYQHRGFNWPMVREALSVNWQRKYYARGASTLTMQLARSAFLYKEKTLWRKLREVVLTRRLENSLSKPRILELYLNVVDWGDQLAGAEAASRFYFGHSAAQLSLEEATLLAALLPNPHYFNPYKRMDSCRKMQQRVIRLLLQAKKITPEQAVAARHTVVRLRGQAPAPEPPASDIDLLEMLPADTTGLRSSARMPDDLLQIITDDSGRNAQSLPDSLP
jgi:monofunctional biosynthetic peptidoglycan transglycosylase